MKFQYSFILIGLLTLVACSDDERFFRFKADQPVPMSAYVQTASVEERHLASVSLMFRESNARSVGSSTAPFVIAGTPAPSPVFHDPHLPKHYAPVSAREVGDKIYVAYVRRIAHDLPPFNSSGNGTISVFHRDGRFIKRLVSEFDQLNQPASMAIAPDDFGAVGNMLLVANAGDGRILAFDIETGEYAGALFQEDLTPIIIQGLKAIGFGDRSPSKFERSLYYLANSKGKGGNACGRITLKSYPNKT